MHTQHGSFKTVVHYFRGLISILLFLEILWSHSNNYFKGLSNICTVASVRSWNFKDGGS